MDRGAVESCEVNCSHCYPKTKICNLRRLKSTQLKQINSARVEAVTSIYRQLHAMQNQPQDDLLQDILMSVACALEEIPQFNRAQGDGSFSSKLSFNAECSPFRYAEMKLVQALKELAGNPSESGTVSETAFISRMQHVMPSQKV